jgi:hypothetical protein
MACPDSAHGHPDSLQRRGHPTGTDLLVYVPTSDYTAVQLRCLAEVVDGPAGKADLLARQLATSSL